MGQERLPISEPLAGLLTGRAMAGGSADNNAWWDETSLALIASGTETLFGAATTVVSALKVASPNGFVAHENGYSGVASDCYVELRGAKALTNQFDNIASNGNVVQCGEVGNVGTDTTFTVALGYGRERRSFGCRCGRRIACSRLHRSRARLPRNFSVRRGLERLCQRAPRGTRQRLQRYAASPRLLRRRDDPDRSATACRPLAHSGRGSAHSRRWFGSSKAWRASSR